MAVGADPAPDQEQLAALELDEGVAEVEAGLADRLDLGAAQDDTRFGPLRNTGSSDVTLGMAELNLRSNGIPQMSACPPGPYQYGRGTILNPCDQFHFWALHTGGSNFLAADGSVKFVPYETSQTVMSAMATRAGNEPENLP